MKIVRKARIYRTNYLKRKSKRYIGLLEGRVCFRDHDILAFNNTTPERIRWFAHRYLMTYIKSGVKFRLKIDNK
jgi:hypothetical protein